MLRRACLLLCLLPATALAAPEDFTLDPVHTRVVFAVDHAGFSKALGTVSGNTGTLHFDPDDWSSARLVVTVPLSRLDLGDPGWNRTVQAHGLLDVPAHPDATFTSTRIAPRDAQHATVCGTLVLRGVGNEVCLEVTFHQLKRHPLPPFRRTAGFSATGTLSRKAFGITAWPKVIGDEVELRIEAEAVRARGGGNDAAPAETVPGDTSPADTAPADDTPAAPIDTPTPDTSR